MGFLVPVAMMAASIGSKLLANRSKKKAAEKQAKSINKDTDRYRQEATAANDVDENRRVERLNAIQGLLQRVGGMPTAGGRVGGSLRAGAPDYTYDPAVLQRMQQKRPFVLPQQGADPEAGIGDQARGGLWDLAGDTADSMFSQYSMGQAGGVAGAAGNMLQGSNAPQSGQADFQVGGGLNPVATPYDPRKPR